MSLFVPVNEPDDVRRELLTCSKDVVSSLRRYEHYREIRKAKLQAFHELMLTWNEVLKLERKLKMALPKTDIRAPPMPKIGLPQEKPQSKPMAEKPKPHEHRTKVQQLEDQLSKIENKLSQLQ